MFINLGLQLQLLMIQMQIQLSKPLKHELNNEGCLCQMCQKIGREQMKHMVVQTFIDYQSQRYPNCKKQYYINIIHDINSWQIKQRKLRFVLPQICVYQNSQPIELISKKYQNQHIKIIYDKTKLHMFGINQFFLEGFIFHNPDHQRNIKKKKMLSFTLSTISQRYKNQCIVIAKYKQNFHELFTLTQMEGLFKSRQKQMRNGLMYLQTLVCTKNFCETRIHIKLDELTKSYKFQRAKTEVKMLHDQIKQTDLQYKNQDQQILYEKQLKQKDIRQYLQYLSLKIVLALSRKSSNTISEGLFKFVHSKGICYLVDVRVQKLAPSEQFWITGAMKIYEMKLSQRMKMMDENPQHQNYLEKSQFTKQQQTIKNLQPQSRNIQSWLDKTTENELNQIKTMRTRLQNLDKQKKQIMKTTSLSKEFKIRRLSKG